jgi:hypothetical protein
MIQDANSVIMLGSGWGEMHNGEGKYGGAEQVLVVRKTGEKRALSSTLQNVFDAWLTLLGQSQKSGVACSRDHSVAAALRQPSITYPKCPVGGGPVRPRASVPLPFQPFTHVEAMLRRAENVLPV